LQRVPVSVPKLQWGMVVVEPDACFFACLAAFFSFAVDAGFFLVSFLLSLSLPMMLRLGYACQMSMVTQAHDGWVHSRRVRTAGAPGPWI